MKKVLVVLALLLVPGIALAVPTITFDTTPGGAGGTLTYDGAGGPLVGTGIVFVDILGVDTPANSGDLMDCVGCSLAFTTGANLQEGPPQWTWAGGGSFTLTGSVPDLGLPAGTALLSGSFTGTPNTPGLAGTDSSALFISLGADTKNEVLAAHYGLPAGPFVFANTEIALGTFVLGAGRAPSRPLRTKPISSTRRSPSRRLCSCLAPGSSGPGRSSGGA